MRQRGSISSHLNPLQRAETANSTASRVRSDSNLEVAAEDEVNGITHPVEPRAKIPMLPPVLVRSPTLFDHPTMSLTWRQNKVIDTHPACSLEFTEDAIITSCKNGKIFHSLLITVR
jgi:hypothetical protein